MKKGFTLVELLVVVTIIGILMAIALVNYRIFLQKGEDAQRKADLRFLQSALEQYNADAHYYPFSITPETPLAFGSKIYLNKVPLDPTGEVYLYEPSGTGCGSGDAEKNCTGYCLYANLAAPSSETGDSSCRKDGYNFGVTRP